MKKKVFYLDCESEFTIQAMDKIIENFPCFIWMVDDETVIEAREEDWPAIEKILAPVV